jgi:hypothetical protein
MSQRSIVVSDRSHRTIEVLPRTDGTVEILTYRPGCSLGVWLTPAQARLVAEWILEHVEVAS